MPIEVQAEDDDDRGLDSGQVAYEALCDTADQAEEFTLLGLLAAVQKRTPWMYLTPQQRELCVLLEAELFEDGDA